MEPQPQESNRARDKAETGLLGGAAGSAVAPAMSLAAAAASPTVVVRPNPAAAHAPTPVPASAPAPAAVAVAAVAARPSVSAQVGTAALEATTSAAQPAAGDSSVATPAAAWDPCASRDRAPPPSLSPPDLNASPAGSPLPSPVVEPAARVAAAVTVTAPPAASLTVPAPPAVQSTVIVTVSTALLPSAAGVGGATAGGGPIPAGTAAAADHGRKLSVQGGPDASGAPGAFLSHQPASPPPAWNRFSPAPSQQLPEPPPSTDPPPLPRFIPVPRVDDVAPSVVVPCVPVDARMASGERCQLSELQARLVMRIQAPFVSLGFKEQREGRGGSGSEGKETTNNSQNPSSDRDSSNELARKVGVAIKKALEEGPRVEGGVRREEKGEEASRKVASMAHPSFPHDVSSEGNSELVYGEGWMDVASFLSPSDGTGVAGSAEGDGDVVMAEERGRGAEEVHGEGQNDSKLQRRDCIESAKLLLAALEEYRGEDVNMSKDVTEVKALLKTGEGESIVSR